MMEIEKYINEYKKECYLGIELTTPFNKDFFHDINLNYENDIQFAFHSELGIITVLDRMTGFGNGIRDIETGYRDKNNNFWLASGNFDVRHQDCKTFGDAIELIKLCANTCIPELPLKGLKK